MPPKDMNQSLDERELPVIGPGQTISSVNDEIRIGANQQIQLVAGQSSITLKGGDIEIVTPGAFTVHGGGHSFEGGGSEPADLPGLPDTRAKLFDEAFIVKNKNTGEPLANTKYRIKRADGSYEYGVTDDKGCTHLVKSVESERVSIELLSDA